MSFHGRAEVIINPGVWCRDIGSASSECGIDPNGPSPQPDTDSTRTLVDDITHELGHILGLKDYHCSAADMSGVANYLTSDMPSVLNTDAEVPHCDPLPFNPTQLDKDDYRTAYLPAVVTGLKAEAKRQTVSLTWNQDAVFVESHFEIQRWSETRWVQVGTAKANSVSAVLTKQPPGQQRYRVVSRTRALPNLHKGPPPVPGPTSEEARVVVLPRITGLTASGSEVNVAFDWEESSKVFVRWELRRSEIKAGDYEHVAATRVDDTSPVAFPGMEQGYWYKVRVRGCEFRQELGGVSGDAEVVGAQAQLEVCGKWSKLSEPVELKPLGVCRPITQGVRGTDASTQRAACKPPAPTSLTVSGVSDNSATLKWEASEGATDYAVRLDGVAVDDSLGDVTEYRFTGLTARTAHVLSVAAKNAVASSAYAELTLLVPPSGVSATATHNSITLTWTLDPRATGAEVRLGATGTVGVADARTSHQFNQGISPSTSYTVYVRAANAQGPSAWASTPATTKTRPVAPPPDPPGGGDDDGDDNGDDNGDDDGDDNGDDDSDDNGDDDGDDNGDDDSDDNGDDDGDDNGDDDGDGDTKECDDGSIVATDEDCPTPKPTTKKCDDGSKVAIGEDCPLPPTRIVTLPEFRTESRTETKFTGPSSCVETTFTRVVQVSVRMITTYSRVNGRVVSSTRLERRDVSHGPWRVDSTRPCSFPGLRGAEGATGFLLPAGDYVLEWGETQYGFTVPVGATVTLDGRLESGKYVAVFRQGEAELVVTPQTLGGVSGQTAPQDATLAAIWASLKEATPVQPDSPATTEHQCAVAGEGDQSATAVNLDTDHCVVVRDGGAIKVSRGGETRSLTLPAGRDWLLAGTVGKEETPAIAIVDLTTGGYLIIKAEDGSELSRNLGDGGAPLGVLFDALVPPIRQLPR